MQTQTPAVTTAPAPPASFTVVGPDGKTQTLQVPRTKAELRDIVRQREALSDQLTNVSQRRGEIASELQTTGDDVARTGLEQRISLLDKRILQIETDIANTGRQVAMAPAQLISTVDSEGPPQGGSDDFAEGMAAGGFSVLLFCTIVFLVARRGWKRKARGNQPQLGGEAIQRLDRLEHGMEAIAIEIERVSEGQRFVTKLLSARENPVRIESI